MLHRRESHRVLKLAIAFFALLFSGVAFADISIRYSGGNHGYGISIGHGVKYYGYGGYNRGYNKYYKPYNRKYYRNKYYRNYSRPHYYYKKRDYYRPRSYSRQSLGHSRSSFNNSRRSYSRQSLGHSRSSFNNSRRSYYSPAYSGTSTYSPAARYYNNSKYSNDPWDSLANGRANKALYAFTKEVQDYPRAGIPKAGYAIAAASSGDLDKGVWAMRRAFNVDPDSLHQLSGDKRLHDSIHELLPRYEYSLKHHGRHKDEAFMVAALNYLDGNHAAARQAAKRAAKDRDRSQSLKNLERLLATNNTAYRY